MSRKPLLLAAAVTAGVILTSIAGTASAAVSDDPTCKPSGEFVSNNSDRFTSFERDFDQSPIEYGLPALRKLHTDMNRCWRKVNSSRVDRAHKALDRLIAKVEAELAVQKRVQQAADQYDPTIYGVSLGMTLDEARATLEEQGFTCKPYNADTVGTSCQRPDPDGEQVKDAFGFTSPKMDTIGLGVAGALPNQPLTSVSTGFMTGDEPASVVEFLRVKFGLDDAASTGEKDLFDGMEWNQDPEAVVKISGRNGGYSVSITDTVMQKADSDARIRAREEKRKKALGSGKPDF